VNHDAPRAFIKYQIIDAGGTKKKPAGLARTRQYAQMAA